VKSPLSRWNGGGGKDGGVRLAMDFAPHLNGDKDTWAIRKAAELLSGFPTEKKIEILNAVSSRNQCEINGNNHCEITVENHHETIMRKTYVCRTWPQLNIGKVRFSNGLFETNDPEPFTWTGQSNNNIKQHDS
jgi:hypothetical protein